MAGNIDNSRSRQYKERWKSRMDDGSGLAGGLLDGMNQGLLEDWMVYGLKKWGLMADGWMVVYSQGERRQNARAAGHGRIRRHTGQHEAGG